MHGEDWDAATIIQDKHKNKKEYLYPEADCKLSTFSNTHAVRPAWHGCDKAAYDKSAWEALAVPDPIFPLLRVVFRPITNCSLDTYVGANSII